METFDELLNNFVVRLIILGAVVFGLTHGTKKLTVKKGSFGEASLPAIPPVFGAGLALIPGLLPGTRASGELLFWGLVAGVFCAFFYNLVTRQLDFFGKKSPTELLSQNKPPSQGGQS